MHHGAEPALTWSSNAETTGGGFPGWGACAPRAGRDGRMYADTARRDHRPRDLADTEHDVRRRVAGLRRVRAPPPAHACALTICYTTSGISKLLAPYQITNGGPIILWQVRVPAFRAPARPVLTPAQSENEYSGWQSPYSEDFVYEQELLTAWVRASPIRAVLSNVGGIP
jgi:hypothetical protein